MRDHSPSLLRGVLAVLALATLACSDVGQWHAGACTRDEQCPDGFHCSDEGLCQVYASSDGDLADQEGCPTEPPEAARPPDCQRLHCELLAAPVCWLCALMADASQDGALCRDGMDLPGLCSAGTCVTVAADGDIDAAWEDVDLTPPRCSRNDDPYCQGSLLYYCNGQDWVPRNCAPQSCISFDGGAICGEAADGDEDQAEQPLCTADKQCPFGFRCLEGACRYANQCEADEHCAIGYLCVADEQVMVCAPGDTCASDADCPYGQRCDTAASPSLCVNASTCAADKDCPSFQTCQDAGHWKECRFSLGSFCSGDADCPAGSYCDAVFGTYGTCKSLNECETDDDCQPGMECVYDRDVSYNRCINQVRCVVDTDCGFGYVCQAGDGGNTCVYANQCTGDDQCASWEVCEASGNYNICRINTQPNFCSSDEDCDQGLYCDTVFGLFGLCKSRDLCLVDEDCPQGTVCQSNGQFMACTDPTPQSCLLDLQCPEGWQCLDGLCQPPQSQAGCPALEKTWTVWNSTCLLLTTGMTLVFTAENGCSGTVSNGQTGIPVGSFSTGDQAGVYAVSVLLSQCSASISLELFMTLDCGSCQASLGGL